VSICEGERRGESYYLKFDKKSFLNFPWNESLSGKIYKISLLKKSESFEDFESKEQFKSLRIS